MQGKIPFNKPFNSSEGVKALSALFLPRDNDSTITTAERLKHSLSEIYSTTNIIPTSSCTHALEAIALSIGLRHGDEVIMSSFNFMSVANAFALRGAKIVFADIDPKTMNIDLDQVEELIGERTKALVLMHYGGVSCDISKAVEICAQYDLLLIEDAAHCIGATFNNQPLGTFGDFGAVSFHHTKNVHSGEGGALIVKDNENYQSCLQIVNKGTDKHAFDLGQVESYNWTRLGSSYTMSEINAAFLIGQLSTLSWVNRSRWKIWIQYLKGLQSIKTIELPSTKNREHNAHIFFIKCQHGDERKELIQHLKECGIDAYFHYPALHLSKAGKQFGITKSDLKYSQFESSRILRLPIYPELKSEDVSFVIESIQQFYLRCQ